LNATRRVILFLVPFLSFAYFYSAGGWNQNSRFALTRAITDRGTLNIDGLEECTGDRAIHNGHFYSDKAPGVALASVPFVAVGRVIATAVGVPPTSFTGVAVLSYVATVATCALPVAIAGLCLFFLALRLGASEGAAAFVTIVFGLGTPMWAYATLFYGHGLSAAGILVGFAAAWALGESRSPRQDVILGAIVGGAAGWATVTEFPAAVPAAILAVFALLRAWPLGRSRMLGAMVALTVAAMTCAAALGAYHWACFGSPFHVAYTSEENFAEMKTGFFGISAPDPARFYQIMFGSYRGLLPLAPVLALGPIGLVMMAWRRTTRSVGIVALLIVAFYLFLNSSYHFWEGGWSYGPRHIAPALGFLCLGLVPLWTAGRTWGRVALGVLGFYGVCLSLIAVSTTPQPPGNMNEPVRELLWPSFRAGRLALNPQGFLQKGAAIEDIVENRDPAAWNIGQRWLGLKGHSSLVPLYVVWVAGLGTWVVSTRRRS
jgi:hypothetical protein